MLDFNWADGPDNLWFMVLIIKEKQRVFILTPGAQTVNPEQVVRWFVT